MYHFGHQADHLEEYFAPIEARQMVYSKPVFIIYNVVSGTKFDAKSIIKKELDEAGIPYVIHETNGPLDAIETA